MTGVALIGSAVAVAILLAASVRLGSLVSTLLAAYLVFVGELGLVTVALSPLREVTRGGLAVAEGILLAAALGVWWVRGRAGLPLGAARTAVSEVVRDPVTATFLALVVALLAYELVLVLTVPPDNWDSLTYHLARVAAWAQHGGIYWIANAPTVRMNAFQPLAEQQVLFTVVASGGEALYALPQYLAELATLVAVYGAARRLGFAPRAAASSAFLVATFSLVVLEATTAQNDLVAASLPVAAACLLLGDSDAEAALGGAATALGLGVKLTTGLVLPVLVWLAFLRGRRAFAYALAGGLVALVTVAMWGYVLNDVHSGALLGAGTAAAENRASPSYPGSVANAFYLMYVSMDVAALSNHRIDLLAVAGAVAAALAAGWALRRSRRRAALGDGVAVALPFLAPLLALGAAGVLAYLARRFGFPIRGPDGMIGGVEHIANEDRSGFGPLGTVALLVAIAATAIAWARRRADARQLALACALPGFLVLMSLQVSWNIFLVRFLLVPVVLAAPLLARLFRGRATTAAYLAVAAVTAGLVVTHDQSKALASPDGRPWRLSQAVALDEVGDAATATALVAFDRLVPASACVGAVLGPDEPSYLLYGRRLTHHVIYLSVNDAVLPAVGDGLFYVVISTGRDRWVAGRFARAGWRIRPLGSYWLLASEPHATTGACGA